MVGKASNLGLSEREGEVGYWIGVPFWGRGLIPEAVRAIISHAFCDLRLETLWCAYFEGNDRSRRVAEKCGFTYHHTNEDVAWELMGDVRTEHAMRLTRRDWACGLPVRWLDVARREEALDLAWRVFGEFNAKEHGSEGRNEFKRTIRDEAYLADLAFLGAFDEGALVAMAAYHQLRHHICLCFVDGRHMRLGLGTRLVRLLVADAAADPDVRAITLNSTPSALPFWQQMGFEATGPERVEQGIRFVPMRVALR
jgi:RimJ/RimL family protein N-acetyltransferase